MPEGKSELISQKEPEVLVLEDLFMPVTQPIKGRG